MFEKPPVEFNSSLINAEASTSSTSQNTQTELLVMQRFRTRTNRPVYERPDIGLINNEIFDDGNDFNPHRSLDMSDSDDSNESRESACNPNEEKIRREILEKPKPV